MAIILFDGECQLCARSVQFIMKRDSKRHFKFASLQSEIGKDILKQVNAPINVDSITVVSEGTYHRKSSAALSICKHLKGLWKAVFYLFIIIPKPLRDILYDFVARNRFKWFGKKIAAFYLPMKINNDFYS